MGSSKLHKMSSSIKISKFVQPRPIFNAVRVTTLLKKTEYVGNSNNYCIYIVFR